MFTKTLLPDTFRAIQLISDQADIKKAYLAGGTALALQLGHRISVDLDFFTLYAFNEKFLSAKLSSIPKFMEDGTAKWTIWGKIGQTKFSMFYYKYPLIGPTVPFEGLQLASLQDIAAMKIHALEDRGTKRDFVDVFILSKHFTLDQMINLYQQKYSVLEDHIYPIIRSLDYFEDAEQEKHMPKMLVSVDWKEVKVFFQNETKRLSAKYLKI